MSGRKITIYAAIYGVYIIYTVLANPRYQALIYSSQ